MAKGRTKRSKNKRNAHKQAIQQNAREQRRIIAIAYYRRNLAEFIEAELGVELYPYQKFLLNKFAKWGFKND
jgi:hypothetical protein